MKKAAIFTTSLLSLALVLGACSSNESKGTDNGGKTTTSEKAKPVSKKSSSSSKENKEVTNGQLLKVGQWMNDDTQGKMELTKVQPINQTVSVDKYSIILKDFKMFKVTPSNADQKKLVGDIFGIAEGLPSPYYEIQIQYTIKNDSDQEVQFNGIKSIVTSNGKQLSGNGGLSDQGVGQSVAANAESTTTAAQGIIDASQKDNLTKLTLNFDSFCTTSDFSDLGTISPFELQIK